MLASDLVKRARSLSDTPNSLFISNTDEIESLYEAYKDIYSKLTDSSDDYYIDTLILSTAGATVLGENEWELTIPADIYKLRFVDFLESGRWVSMQKFNTNNRNRAVPNLQYRWKGAKLWLIGSNFTGLPPTIRIDYYPPPVKPSVPEATRYYGLAYTQSVIPLVQSPQYFSVPNPNGGATDYLVYIYNGTDIKVESRTLNTTKTLFTSTGLSNVIYYLGNIYYLKSGNIYKASTDLLTTITPVAIISTGTVTSFTISGSKIYYTGGTNTSSATLAGSGVASLYAYNTLGANIIAGDLYFIKVADGLVYKNGTSTGLAASLLNGDGEFLYYVDSLGILHKYTALTDEIIAQNITFIGMPQNNFISALNTPLEIIALSTLSDTDFTYPVNEANEIMAYQSAIDYKRKQNGDTSELKERLAGIYDRFMDVIKRDEGQPERRTPEAPQWNY